MLVQNLRLGGEIRISWVTLISKSVNDHKIWQNKNFFKATKQYKHFIKTFNLHLICQRDHLPLACSPWKAANSWILSSPPAPHSGNEWNLYPESQRRQHTPCHPSLHEELYVLLSASSSPQCQLDLRPSHYPHEGLTVNGIQTRLELEKIKYTIQYEGTPIHTQKRHILFACT